MRLNVLLDRQIAGAPILCLAMLLCPWKMYWERSQEERNRSLPQRAPTRRSRRHRLLKCYSPIRLFQGLVQSHPRPSQYLLKRPQSLKAKITRKVPTCFQSISLCCCCTGCIIQHQVNIEEFTKWQQKTGFTWSPPEQKRKKRKVSEEMPPSVEFHRSPKRAHLMAELDGAIPQ